MKDTEKGKTKNAATGKTTVGFTDEERAAMKERAKEVKAAARSSGDRAEGGGRRETGGWRRETGGGRLAAADRGQMSQNPS